MMPEKDYCLICQHTSFIRVCIARDHLVSNEEFPVLECEQCGFMFTGEAPEAGVIDKYYKSSEYISHTGGSGSLTDMLYGIVRKIMLGVKSGTLKRITNKRNGRLLDIGAGTGHFVSKMQSIGWEAQGIEVSEDARNYALQVNKAKLASSPGEIDISSGGFDVVTLWHVLEHIHDPGGYLQFIHKALNDTGILAVAVPNIVSADSKHYRGDWAALDAPRHLWHFNRETLNSLISRYGFSLIRVTIMPFDSLYVPVLSEKNRKSRFPLLIGMAKGYWFWGLSLFDVTKSSSLTFYFKKV
ncbi:MAG: class I SAM-dependent methyltransferase [Bacteroidetes bacterium]|nr:class I SAM-dependent methyltransferase [Bacteroidota bacterium]